MTTEVASSATPATPVRVCVLCGEVVHGLGHNPSPVCEPVFDEGCCDYCNATRVIPARFSQTKSSIDWSKVTWAEPEQKIAMARNAAIRERHATGESVESLAAEHGKSPAAVRRILKYRCKPKS